MNNKSIRRFLRYARSTSLLLVLILSLGSPASVYAATITVNTTTDELNNDGDCSLREAIQATNTDAVVDACLAGSGADTITLPSGTYTLSIPPGAEQEDDLSLSQRNLIGDLDITSNLTIEGAGARTTIVDGAHLDRVFHINLGGTTVGISGVTIQNGVVGPQGGNTISGGGIANPSGTLTITDSTISGNSAIYGGGITNGSGSTTLINSTVSGNSATNNGGGIYNGGSLTLINTTVSGNSASNGGGIGSVGGGSSQTNVTITGNTAGNGGGLWFAFGSIATLKNTIVANSAGGNCSGSFTSAGHNLSSDGSCSLTDVSDLINTDPLLDSLAYNGGPTQTHALLAGSPAIDAGSSDCPPPATDQRGVLRPTGAACDIGAFEFTTPTVIYNFSGFFQPVDNLPTLNLVKAGQGIPVKFSLNGDQGLNIFAAGYPISQQINCDSNAPVDGIEVTRTAGSSSLSYDPVTDTYTYVWKTDKAWTNTCRQLIVKLNDDTYHRANFKFK